MKTIRILTLTALVATSSFLGVAHAEPQEKAKDIVKAIKNSKLKVQASIQGDFVRVSGKDRDTLQQVMALLRQGDYGVDLQFTNYRSN